jgi:hypothetical protein
VFAQPLKQPSAAKKGRRGKDKRAEEQYEDGRQLREEKMNQNKQVEMKIEMRRKRRRDES